MYCKNRSKKVRYIYVKHSQIWLENIKYDSMSCDIEQLRYSSFKGIVIVRLDEALSLEFFNTVYKDVHLLIVEA